MSITNQTIALEKAAMEFIQLHPDWTAGGHLERNVLYKWWKEARHSYPYLWNTETDDSFAELEERVLSHVY